MQNLWMLSPTATNSLGQPYPTCSAYATSWTMPWFPAPAGTVVPVAHVQSANNSSLAGTLSPLVATFGKATTVGNLVIVTVMQDGTSISPGYSTVTDSAGNVYQSTVISNYLSDTLEGAGSLKQDIYWAITTASATTVTVTSPGGSQKNYWVGIHEYSGVSALDYTNATVAGQNQAVAAVTGNAFNPITITIPATVNGELIFAMYGASGNGTPFLASTGYTQRGYLTPIGPTGGSQFGVMEQDSISTGGTTSVYNSGGVVSYGNGQTDCYVLTFLPAKVPTGLGLVYVQATALQAAAAASDPTITVLAGMSELLPLSVANSYYLENATTTMTVGTLLQTLAALDPNFNCDPNVAAYGASATQVNSDWNAAGGVAEILNKPTLPSTFVSSVAGLTGAVVLAESNITGLVTDLGNTEKTANKGVANGYAPLNSAGQVPAANLPSASGGGSSIVASVKLSAASSVSTGTVLTYTSVAGGYYRATAGIQTQTYGGGGTATLTLGWGLQNGTAYTTTSLQLSETSLTTPLQEIVAYRLKAGGTFTYSVAISGASGSPTYDLDIVLELLAA